MFLPVNLNLTAGRRDMKVSSVGASRCSQSLLRGAVYETETDSPLALAGVENQLLVVLGTDCELMLCRVEDVKQQMTLTGAVDRRRKSHYDMKPDR